MLFRSAHAVIRGTPRPASEGRPCCHHRDAQASITGTPRPASQGCPRCHHRDAQASITGMPTLPSQGRPGQHHRDAQASITGMPTLPSGGRPGQHQGDAHAAIGDAHAMRLTACFRCLLPIPAQQAQKSGLCRAFPPLPLRGPPFRQKPAGGWTGTHTRSGPPPSAPPCTKGPCSLKRPGCRPKGLF